MRWNQTKTLLAPDTGLGSGGDEPETVFLREGEVDPDAVPEVKLPDQVEIDRIRKENEVLRQQVDLRGEIKGGLDRLGERFTPSPSPPVNVPNIESEEAFAQRFENEQFQSGKAYRAVQQAVYRTVGPLIGTFQDSTVSLTKRVLKLDPETGPFMKKYEKEIDETYRALPAELRMRPNAMMDVFSQVVANHREDIVRDTADERMKKMAEEAGMDIVNGKLVVHEEGAPVKAKASSSFMESGRGMAASTGQRKVEKIRYTESDEARAMTLGLSVEDYMLHKRGK